MKPLLSRGEAGSHSDVDLVVGLRRTPQEVARRALILCCVTASLEFPPGEFNSWLQREGLWDEVSPAEAALLTSEAPTERQKIYASWRSEALQVLLWALGEVEVLPPLSELYAAGMLDGLPAPGEATANFINSARLRPDAEIDAALESIVDAHWQIRNEESNLREKAASMNRGVVVERHWALEWLVNFENEPWDQTPLST